MLERIFLLAKKNAVLQKDLATELEVNPSVLSDWKKGRIKPSIDNIIKIAKYFDVTTDYLLGISDLPKGSVQQAATTGFTGEPLGKDELELLSVFNELDTCGKQRLLGYAASLVDMVRGKTDSSSIVD